MCFGLESPFDKSFAGIRSVINAFHNDDSGTQLRLNISMEKRILRLEDEFWRIRTDTGELADAERNALRAYLCRVFAATIARIWLAYRTGACSTAFLSSRSRVPRSLLSRFLPLLTISLIPFHGS
jgi:hypothetical protein